MGKGKGKQGKAPVQAPPTPPTKGVSKNGNGMMDKPVILVQEETETREMNPIKKMNGGEQKKEYLAPEKDMTVFQPDSQKETLDFGSQFDEKPLEIRRSKEYLREMPQSVVHSDMPKLQSEKEGLIDVQQSAVVVFIEKGWEDEYSLDKKAVRIGKDAKSLVVQSAKNHEEIASKLQLIKEVDLIFAFGSPTFENQVFTQVVESGKPVVFCKWGKFKTIELRWKELDYGYVTSKDKIRDIPYYILEGSTVTIGVGTGPFTGFLSNLFGTSKLSYRRDDISLKPCPSQTITAILRDGEFQMQISPTTSFTTKSAFVMSSGSGYCSINGVVVGSTPCELKVCGKVKTVN